MRDAVAHFPREVQPLAIVLEHVDDAQALLVVVEPAGNELVEHALARMPERRVPEIVAERDRLGQLLVQLQHLGDRSRDLRDLERVRQPRAVVIAGRREEHLRLVLEPAKRLRVHDAIAIALKRRTHVVFGLFAQAPARVGALRRLRRQNLPLARLEVFTDARHSVFAQLVDWQIVIEDCESSASANLPISPMQIIQKALAVLHRTDAEIICHRLAEVCKRRARAEVDARFHRRPGHQQRHVLARVIGARRRGIVAVIGGDHHQIVVTQPRQQILQPRVEALEIGGIARARRCGGRTACRNRRGSRRSTRAASTPSPTTRHPRPRRRSSCESRA